MVGKKRTGKSQTWVQFRNKVIEMHESGTSYSEIAEKLGVSKANLHVKLFKCSTLESDFYMRFKEIYG